MTNYAMDVYGGTTHITNTDLKKELDNIVKAISTMEKSTWKFARALHRIESQKLYESDYGSARKFCEEKKLSSSTLTKAYKGVEVLDKVLIPSGYTEDDFTFNHCYVLDSLGDDLQKFIDEIIANNRMPKIEKMTVPQLSDYVKKWKSSADNVIDVEAKVKASAQETVEDENTIKALKNGLKIHFNGKDYFIKYEDLNQYEKKAKA